MFNPFKEIDWRPGVAEMRTFGWSLIAAFMAIGSLLLLGVRWQSGRWEMWPMWLGAGGAALGGLCVVLPRAGWPVYAIWHAVGGLAGLVISNAMLAAVFYLIITPIGLGLRILGRDPLRRRWDSAVQTYWDDAEKPVDMRSYFRQF